MLFSVLRTVKNIVGGGPDEQVKKLSDVLANRRKAFMDQAAITTEVTVFHILDDVAKMSTQLEGLSNQLSHVGK